MSARILLAEDDPIQRMELSQMLKEQGYLVVGEVADGQSVVDVASTLRPDLVLMDICLPERDGMSAAAILRQEDIAPVVLLSAFSGHGSSKRRKMQECSTTSSSHCVRARSGRPLK